MRSSAHFAEVGGSKAQVKRDLSPDDKRAQMSPFDDDVIDAEIVEDPQEATDPAPAELGYGLTA